MKERINSVLDEQIENLTKLKENNYSEEVIIKFLDKKIKRVVVNRPKVYEKDIINSIMLLN